MVNDFEKELVAKKIAQLVRDGDTIGVGSGSTVSLALDFIKRRVTKDRLTVQVVPTSLESAWQSQAAGLTVLNSAYLADLTWGFDGADAVDRNLWLIKGKGGALFQEKVVAARCKKFIVLVDRSKLYRKLEDACPVPLEVLPQAKAIVEKQLKKLGAVSWQVREGSGKRGPVITEQGNIIIDIVFKKITSVLEKQLKSLVGVVETGLFIGYASEVWVGEEKGVRVLK